ncbi:MAG: GIY-YIG nuclease family protein [bacterium]
MNERQYHVYILASRRNGTLYVGVTSDLVRRMYEHKNVLASGFTKEHGVKSLVWFGVTSDVREALKIEKRLKRWRRKWKLELIESDNPDWRDLSSEWSA